MKGLFLMLIGVAICLAVLCTYPLLFLAFCGIECLRRCILGYIIESNRSG